MRRFFLIPFGLVAVVALLLATGGFWIYGEFTKPGPLAQDKVLVIESGSGVNTIANQLAGEGVVSDARLFRLGTRFLSDKAIAAVRENGGPQDYLCRRAEFL